MPVPPVKETLKTPAVPSANRRVAAAAAQPGQASGRLQRSIGNQAVLRLATQSPGPIYPKLAVGRVDDPLEHEADRVAERVTAMADADVRLTARGAPVQRKCSACDEEDEQVHRKEASGAQDSAVIPAAVHDTLAAPGHALDAQTRAFFEPRFGRDFGDVRVHTGGRAAASARALNALAYTRGSDIVFAEGRFGPSTPEGRKLLAHELAHVVQQDLVPRSKSGGVVQRAPASPAEATTDGSTPLDAPPEQAEAPELPLQFDDEQVAREVGAKAGYANVMLSLLPRMGGLRGLEGTHPQTFLALRNRIIASTGRLSFLWAYENDAEILRLVRNSQAIQARAQRAGASYLTVYRDGGYESARAHASFYELDYRAVLAGYQQVGKNALVTWTLLLADVESVAQYIEAEAARAEINAERAASLAAARKKRGLAQLGQAVATHEMFAWWDDAIALQDLMAPEDGVEDVELALAWARLSQRAAAVVKVDERYFIYGLSKNVGYTDIWEASWFEEHRTRVVPAGRANVFALTTREGYVLTPTSGRYFGGEQSRDAGGKLDADLRVLEKSGEDLDRHQAFALLRQTALDMLLLRMADADAALKNEQVRLAPSGFDPDEGERLQQQSAALRRHALRAAQLAFAMGEHPTEQQQRDAADELAAVGRLTQESPSAAMMVISTRQAEDTSDPPPAAVAPQEADVEDRLAGKLPGDALLLVLDELRIKRANLDKVRRHFYANPDDVFAFPSIVQQARDQFPDSQQLSLSLGTAGRTLQQIAKILGMTAVDAALLLAAFVEGPVGWVAWGVGVGRGVMHTADAFKNVDRLSAMTNMDLSGTLAMATPEQLANARFWAWVGLGLTILDAALFLRSTTHLVRLRSVLQSPEVGLLLRQTDMSIGEVAKALDISERQLVRELATLRGPAREALLDRIADAAGIKGGGLHSLSGDWARAGERYAAMSAQELEAVRVALLARADIGAVQATLRSHGVDMSRETLEAIKRYLFNSRGIAFSGINFLAWQRLAKGGATVQDAAFLAHEAAELRALEDIRRGTGFDYMGSGWDKMKEGQRRQWLTDFDRYYGQAHATALEHEFDFLAQQVALATKGRVRPSRTVLAAIDRTSLGVPMSRGREARQYMLVDGVLLQDHRNLAEWAARGRELVSVGAGTVERLRLPGNQVTLADLLDAIQRSQLR
jgi:hypothetical protein